MVDETRKDALRTFLMQCRARIHPEEVGLSSGGRRRVPGLRREEVADLAGTSLMWYTLLETGRDIRVSARLLDRVSSALRLNDEEKVYLFSLAVDELPMLPRATLHPRSTDVLEAFSSMRSLSRRLWVATTQEEALTLAREYAKTQLSADVIATRTRVGEGNWEYASIGDAEDRGELVLAVLRERWGPAILDDIHCCNLMSQPGDLVTAADEVRFPDIAAKRRAALAEVGWADVSWAMVNVQSHSGFVARLIACFHDTTYAFSEIERAQLSTLAGLTSYALSGCVSSGEDVSGSHGFRMGRAGFPAIAGRTISQIP